MCSKYSMKASKEELKSDQPSACANSLPILIIHAPHASCKVQELQLSTFEV